MKRKQKARVTVAKKDKGKKGYDVNVGGRKRFGFYTKRKAEQAAKRLRKKRAKK